MHHSIDYIPHLFRGRVTKVVSHYQVRAEVDLGLDITIVRTFRLANITPPDMRMATGAHAAIAMDHMLNELLQEGTDVLLVTYPDPREKDAYEAAIWVSDPDNQLKPFKNIETTLIEAGHCCWTDATRELPTLE